jgi:hypothetical protein
MNRLLVRLFFQDFFRLSFLDDAGEESFRRVIIGLLGGFIAIGLWLPRMYIAKYEAGAQWSPETFRAILLADQLVMIGLPMFIVAVAVALVCHSLFPDEMDYRILMVLPVDRVEIFSAKAAALFLFAAIFIVTTNVAIGVPFSAVSSGPLATHYWPVRAAFQLAAGMAAGIFAVAAIVAVQGLVVVLTPRAWLRPVSVATQTALVCALVLVLPAVLRLPSLAPQLHARSVALGFAPPVWFLGLQEVLLGNREPYFVRLAEVAALGFTAVCVLAATCYIVVYRRFDRVILRDQPKGHRGIRRAGSTWLGRLQPETQAVYGFTVTTLRRSGLHQLVFLGIAAAGLALVFNSVFGAGLSNARRQAVLWSPFVLIFASALGLRLSLLLPLNRRAAWVFRLTEDDERRVHQFPVVELVVICHAVLAPMAMMLPFQLAVLGVRGTLLCVPVIFVMGLLLVEIILTKWHRIAFTCSYLPGKRPVTHEVLILITSFVVFTWAGMGLSGWTIARGYPPPTLLLVLVAISAAFRWVRLQRARNTPLEFEDELPESSYGLKLNT